MADGRIASETPDGEVASSQGSAGNGRTVPVPECRQPLAAAVKSQTELELLSVTRTGGVRRGSLGG